MAGRDTSLASAGCPDHREQVRPAWTDRDGYLRPAFLVVIFDHAIDALYEGLGLGEAYRRETSFSTFTLETHALLERPIRRGEELLVRNCVLAVDSKRMHIAQEMFGAQEMVGAEGRVRAALMEQLSIHVDLAIRRSAPFPPERLARIRAAIADQRDRPAPAGTGQQIRLDPARSS